MVVAKRKDSRLKQAARFLAGAKAWNWSLILRIAGAVFAAIIVILIYRALFITPQALRTEGAQAKHDAKAAQGEVTVGREAMETMETRADARERTRVIVRENTREIRTAPGASTRVPPAVHDAFVRGIGRLREQADQHSGPDDQLPGDGS